MASCFGPRLGVWLAVATLGVISAQAQAHNTGSNRGEAVLHIRVNVVPVLIAPRQAEPKRPLTGTIGYDLSTASPKIEIIEEMRPLLIPNSSQPEGIHGAILKTLTIVPR